MDAMNIEAQELQPHPAQPIEETDTSVSYLGVKLAKADDSSSPFVPRRDRYEGFINDRLALDMQKQIAVALLQGNPILIEGGTSIGKTTTVRKMAAELGYEVHYANLKGSSDADEFMGKYIPNPDKKTDGDPEYIFADGKVTQGLRQEEGKVKVIVLDEYNAASPNVLIRLHEVLDSLERGESVVLSEDASEAITVDKEKTKVVALMNPPGKGYLGRETIDPAQLRRWTYIKAPTDLPPATFSYATKSLFGLAPQIEAVPQEAYLPSRDEALLQEQLEEVPGINEIVGRYEEFHRVARELVHERRIGADQPQAFTFDDRVEPKRVHDFILRFYNGDVNHTIQEALRYYYVNKVESPEDKAKLEELIRHVEYQPTQSVSQRKPLEDMEEFEGKDTIPAGSFDKPTGSEGLANLEKAKKIMGEDYLGEDMVQEVFGVRVRPPELPFSEKELKLAKDLGQFLILRVDSLGRTPLTMKNLETHVAGKIEAAGKGKFLFDTGWYAEEDFFKKDRPQTRWALVGKDVIPGSANKDYFAQTDEIASFIGREAFRGTDIPPQYNEAILEFQDQRGELAKLLSSDWQEAAKRLSELKINQLTRHTPVEIAYDLAANLLFRNRRLLEGKYAWTNRQTSGGRLVIVGGFQSSGADVDDWYPDAADDHVGVCLSRVV